MPYGYSTVPYLGGDAVENYAHESSVVMNDVLRGRLGYDGIIQTDWGLNHIVAMQAGADVMGGMGQRDVTRMVDQVDPSLLTDRCRRLLLAKFRLGVFENPTPTRTKSRRLSAAKNIIRRQWKPRKRRSRW